MRKKLAMRIAALFIINIALICAVRAFTVSAEATYSSGSTGNTVTKIQTALKKAGFYAGTVDGIFGSQTESSVKKFQQANGLTADGVVGARTLQALGISSGTTSASVSTAGKTINNTLKQGSSGSEVKLLQQALKDTGYYMGATDGIFGGGTKSAVQAFQSAKNLTADGVAGPKTLKALGFKVGTTATSGTSANRSAQLNLLARLINGEARGEPYNGQVAVGAVVLNRVKHPSFPNTMEGVIYQPNAFTCVKDGQMNKPVQDSCYRAAEDALNGVDPSKGAVFFFNPKATSDKFLHSLKNITITIGSHKFATI